MIPWKCTANLSLVSVAIATQYTAHYLLLGIWSKFMLVIEIQTRKRTRLAEIFYI